MDRDALIASPDLHRAQPLPHLHRRAHRLPVDPVARSLPADKAVPGDLPVLPEIGRQGDLVRQLTEMGPLLVQHLPRYPVSRAMHSGVGYNVAPLQGLPVQVGVIGEAQAGPHVAPDILHPALDLALGLGLVGLAQPGLKADPQGEVQHPPVPHRPFLLVPAQGDHLGVVVQTAAGHAAQVLERIHVALDEGGGVRPADQLHVAGPGPAQRHHEHPDAVSLPVLADVRQAAPVDLGLLTGRRLKAHRRLGLFVLPPGADILHHSRVAAPVPQGPDLPVQHPAILQAFRHPPVDMLGVGVQLRPPRRPRPGTHGLRGLQVPAHRVAGHVQLPGNPPDRTARSFHLVDLFHLSHLQQCVSHTSAESLRMMPPLSGGSVPSCYFRPFLTCY